MRKIIGVGADSAEDAHDALNEQRRLDQPAVDEVGQVIDMGNVVALKLEAGAVGAAGGQDTLDVGEGVLEDQVAAVLQVAPFPIRT